jgi:hypothetical protein
MLTQRKNTKNIYFLFEVEEIIEFFSIFFPLTRQQMMKAFFHVDRLPTANSLDRIVRR